MDDLRAIQKMAIENHLSMLAAHENVGRSFAAFLLEHGRYYTPAPLPAGMRRGVVKQCYANSQKAVVRAVSAGRKPLTYVEGFACSGGLSVALPMQHGWLADEDGNVVDPTWELPAQSAYFGVAFETDYVMSRSALYRNYDSLLDDRRDGWSLLNDPVVTRSAIVGADVCEVVSPSRPHL